MLIDLNAPIIQNGSFKWKEYLYLPAWHAYAIPTAQEVKDAITFFTQLEVVRRHWGAPITIESGARPDKYNLYLRTLGHRTATASMHRFYRAADLRPTTGKTKDLYELCRKVWKGRMEHWNATKGGAGEYDGWVHLDNKTFGNLVIFTP